MGTAGMQNFDTVAIGSVKKHECVESYRSMFTLRFSLETQKKLNEERPEFG